MSQASRYLSPLGLPNLSVSLEKLGWRAPQPLGITLFLDRRCVMEWEEPHDSTFYCLQTDGNHLLATGSSYYGLVRLWDRRQRACLHVSVPPSVGLWDVKTHCELYLRAGDVAKGVPKVGCNFYFTGLNSRVGAPHLLLEKFSLLASLAGLPADVDAAQQSGVLPAVHHQASLCCVVLQPPHPRLSKPMTDLPCPWAGQVSYSGTSLAWQVK